MNTHGNRAALLKSLTGQAAAIYSWPMVITSFLTLMRADAWVTLVSGVLGFCLSYLFHRYRAGRLNAALTASAEQNLRYIDPDAVRTLIATAYVGQGAAQAVGTLIEKLPNLQTIHLIVGHSDAGVNDQADLIEKLTEHARIMGRAVNIDPRPVAIAPWEVHRDDPVLLRTYLGRIPAGSDTWVDVTGGTVAMSLAVARAVESTGHNICYTANDRTRRPPVYFGVVDVTRRESVLDAVDLRP